MARFMHALLIAGACLALNGCLDREERITVHADGSIAIRHTLAGDPSDLDGGAARLPQTTGPYAIERFVRQRDDKTEGVLTATGRFDRATDIPTTFAPTDDPLAAAALSFSTRLCVRREADRTVYLFERRYAPRTWARYHHHFRQAIPEALETRCKGTPFERLPDADRRAVLRGLADFERRKMHVFIRSTLRDLDLPDDRRTEGWLAAARAIDAYHDTKLRLPRLESLLALPAAAQETATRAIQKDMRTAALDALMRVLGTAGPARGEIGYRLALAHESYDVTEDLGDENFTVRVTLPGVIDAHNGTIRDGAVEWRFDGKALRDRETVLVARSVVKH